MEQKFPRILNVVIAAVFVFQLTGCGTLLYPERRGQTAGRLDTGVVILDAIGLLFFIIPGAIAFAVDFGNGTIYLPASPLHKLSLREFKFDPKHDSIAQVEKIIKEQTGYALNLTQGNVRVSRLKSKDDMMVHFAQEINNEQASRLAFAR